MSLQVRLEALISAIGADIKELQSASSGGTSVLYVWRTGETAPTLPLPAGTKWEIQLGLTTAVPAWVPVGSKIVRSAAWGS